MGLPRLPSSMFHWIFHEINHLFWGTPIFRAGKPQIIELLLVSIHPWPDFVVKMAPRQPHTIVTDEGGSERRFQPITVTIKISSVPASHLFDSRRASDVLQFGAQFDAGGFDGWKFDEVLGTCHAGFFLARKTWRSMAWHSFFTWVSC